VVGRADDYAFFSMQLFRNTKYPNRVPTDLESEGINWLRESHGKSGNFVDGHGN